MEIKYHDNCFYITSEYYYCLPSNDVSLQYFSRATEEVMELAFEKPMTARMTRLHTGQPLGSAAAFVAAAEEEEEEQVNWETAINTNRKNRAVIILLGISYIL